MCVTVYLPWRFDSFPQSQLNTSMMIEYKLMIREPSKGLIVHEVSEDRKHLEAKVEVLLEENPTWEVFVVRETYNVS
jgi:hypothetical protein